MDKYLQFNELNLIEAADFLGVTVNHLLLVTANGDLQLKFKDPYVKNEWHIIDPTEIKKAFDSGLKTINLITLEDEEGTTSNWDCRIKFEQAKIFKSELIQYKSKLSKPLEILKEDMTELRFDGELFIFKADKASLVKVLYSRIKSHPDNPSMHERDIFNAANYSGEGEHRIAKVFRTKKRPEVLDNLIIRTAQSTYRFAPFVEI